MQRDEAAALLQEWRQLYEGTQAPQEVEAHLWRALTVLIPDDCDAAAIPIRGIPGIVAVAGMSILETTVAGDASSPGLCVRRRGVDSAAGSVVLVETLEEVGGHPAVGGLARLREWAFDPGDGQPALQWSTRQVLSGGFESDRQVARAERLARRMASAFGWPIPSVDEPGPDWP